MNIFQGPRSAELHLHPSFTPSGELPASVVTFLPWSLGTTDTSINTFSVPSSVPKVLQDFSHFIGFGVYHNSWLLEVDCWKLSVNLGLTSNVFIGRPLTPIILN